MARIEDLVSQVGDARVRAELADEVAHLKSRRTFGLVFERHIPETVMIPNGTVKAGATVVRRADEGCLPLRVHAVADGMATVTPLDGAATEPVQVPVADLGLLLTFGEAVYPTLTSLGAVRAGGDAPYHAVINGENLHALELLAAIHEGDVDCIYIDPPYNSGARDWKYKNDFVDINDRWRHSKWLSFMEKRLRVARRLLRPDGVLVITIDENEVFHLGVLLEELFPDYLHYMVTDAPPTPDRCRRALELGGSLPAALQQARAGQSHQTPYGGHRWPD